MSRIIWLLLALPAAFSLSACSDEPSGTPASPTVPDELTIAVPRQALSTPMMVAVERGLLEKHSLAVTVLWTETGRDAVDALLAGQAGFALTAETPIVLASDKPGAPRVIATVATARDYMQLVGIEGSFDAAVGRGSIVVGYTAGTNAEFIAPALVDETGIHAVAVEWVSVEPEGFASGLESGRLHAVVAWQPHINRLRRHFAGNLAQVSRPDIYTMFWNLVRKWPGGESPPQAVTERLLLALIDAEHFLRMQPALTTRIVAGELGLGEDLVSEILGDIHFSLSLDQALLSALEQQHQWLEKYTNSARGEINFLRVLDDSALRAVADQRATIDMGSIGN